MFLRLSTLWKSKRFLKCVFPYKAYYSLVFCVWFLENMGSQCLSKNQTQKTQVQFLFGGGFFITSSLITGIFFSRSSRSFFRFAAKTSLTCLKLMSFLFKDRCQQTTIAIAWSSGKEMPASRK